MRRVLSAILGAVDAFAIVAISLGGILVLSTISWIVQFGFAGSILDVWRFSVHIWLIGHAVDVSVTPDPVLVAQLGLDQMDAFPFTLAVLGIGLITLVGGWRSGRRVALADAPLTAAVGSISVLAGVSAVLSLSAISASSSAVFWQAVVFPAAFFAGGMLIGIAGTEAGTRAWGWLASGLPGYTNARPTTKSALRAAWRSALGIWVGGLGLGALALTVMFIVNYGSVIGLYQTLQAGIWGGIVLTIGELLLLPTLAVWGTSWMFGAGFSIGVGTSVSPAATLAGGVPGVPVFAAIPLQSGQWGLLILLVPALLSFTVSALARREADRHTAPASTGALFGSAFVTGVLSAALLAGSAWLASGAIGPGAMGQVGPNPLLLAGCSFVIVFVSTFLGGVAGRTLRA